MPDNHKQSRACVSLNAHYQWQPCIQHQTRVYRQTDRARPVYCIHSVMHTHTHTCTNTHEYKHMSTDKQSHKLTHRHTGAHTQTHIHTHLPKRS
jgi:hypothetical protein